MQPAAYTNMYSELGLLPKEYKRKGIKMQLQHKDSEDNEQAVEPEKLKRKNRTMLWT